MLTVMVYVSRYNSTGPIEGMLRLSNLSVDEAALLVNLSNDRIYFVANITTEV